MACSAKEHECLLCKNSIIGESCDIRSFSECTMEQLTDRITVYKVKIDFLNSKIDNAKLKGKLGVETKKNIKAMKQACKTKQYLEEKQLTFLKLQEMKKESFKNIKEKDIIQHKKSIKFDFMKICKEFKSKEV